MTAQCVPKRRKAAHDKGNYGAMKHKNSHLLVGYWSRLRKGRDVPDQTDIDPRAIKRLLSYTFILDCENPARPVYRLAGTALCERFGFELKGTGFLAHWEAQSGLSLSPLLRQALKLRQPVCISSVAATADNGMVELETILTPVSFNGSEPTRFFGLVQMLSDPTPLRGRAQAYERRVSGGRASAPARVGLSSWCVAASPPGGPYPSAGLQLNIARRRERRATALWR